MWYCLSDIVVVLLFQWFVVVCCFIGLFLWNLVLVALFKWIVVVALFRWIVVVILFQWIVVVHCFIRLFL